MSTNVYSAVLVAASSQSFSTADSSSLSVTSNITLELWVKLATAPTSGNQFQFINKNSGSGNNLSYSCSYVNVAGTFKIRMFVSSDGSTADTMDFTFTIPTGTWTHVAFSWQASTHTCTFIVNGVSQGTTVGTATAIFDSNSAVVLGSSGSGDFFNGKMDEVRIWSTNLSAATVLANYKTQIDTAVNLVASWHLDNALTDSTGNGNTLSNNNSITFSSSDVPFFVFGVSDSIMNGKSVTATVAYMRTLPRSISDSISYGAGRTINLVGFKQFIGKFKPILEIPFKILPKIK